ncbi:ribonucleotide-diphosphate reductase subunit beta, partial [Brochothrix thermosphacta]
MLKKWEATIVKAAQSKASACEKEGVIPVTTNNKAYTAINWNEIEDVLDKKTWEKLTEQFWLDTRIPISNDLDDWRSLSDVEKHLVERVFGGLTLLDTLQSQD